MRWVFAFGWLPAPVIYTAWTFKYTHLMARVIPFPFFPIVLVHPGAKSDEGLHIHETTHLEQAWRSLFTYGPRYLISREYRQRCEVEAYKKQLGYSGKTFFPLAIHYLVHEYGLGITKEQAAELLDGE